MRTFVLCAGEGSRLYPFSDLIPKSLMYVGGKPVIRWIIERLASYDFRDIVLCVNEKDHSKFVDYCEDGSRFGVHIVYSISQKPLGTVGEILNAINFVNGDFLLYYGDELTKIDLEKLQRAHELAKRILAVGTLALIKNVPSEVGIAELWSSTTIDSEYVFPQIISFKEKPLIQNVWSGIAMLIPEILKLAKEGDDFARDLFPRLIVDHKPLYAYMSDVDWMDTGTLSHYKRACKLAEEGKL